MKKKIDDKKDFVVQDKTVNEKEQKKNKKKVKGEKKPNIFKRMGAKLKDVFSELKKVTWLSFPEVVKKTGVVIVVVLAFLIVITAFDFGLYELLKLIV